MQSKIVNIIKDLDNLSYYKDYSYKKIQKQYLYDAFIDFSSEIEFQNFLLLKNRKGNYHSKILQKYLEKVSSKLPINFLINQKPFIYKSLNDLNFFDKIVSFDCFVDSNIIKNQSKDYFISRSNSDKLQPYYIGKIASITDINTCESLLKNVKEYTFNKIYVNDNMIGKNITITYYAIKPHHESGILGHINRIIGDIRDKNKTS